MRGTLHQRWMSKVQFPDDPADATACWLWTASLDKDGYGELWDKVRDQGIGAHRVSYELTFGTIPDGRLVLHTCDNRACVRPTHLYLGSVQHNIRDAVRRGRNPKAETHGMAKLTWLIVRAIRYAVAGGATQRSQAVAYNVSEQAISRIVNNLSWKE